jgi:probable phosphoglycerate mutase
VQAEEPERYEQWMTAPDEVTFPRGENLAQVRQRALAAIGLIHTEHPDGTVAACTHRVVCKVLICGLLGVPDRLFWRIRQDATCVNLLEISRHGNATLVKLNDTHHTADVPGSGGLADF